VFSLLCYGRSKKRYPVRRRGVWFTSPTAQRRRPLQMPAGQPSTSNDNGRNHESNEKGPSSSMNENVSSEIVPQGASNEARRNEYREGLNTTAVFPSHGQTRFTRKRSKDRTKFVLRKNRQKPSVQSTASGEITSDSETNRRTAHLNSREQNVETSISLSSFEDCNSHLREPRLSQLGATGDQTRTMDRSKTEPYPRAAPWQCITSSSVDSSCNGDGFCSDNDPSSCTLDTPCCQVEDLDYLRMMKARMMKLEDTIELMYKKFKLHEDNIDEMQVWQIHSVLII